MPGPSPPPSDITTKIFEKICAREEERHRRWTSTRTHRRAPHFHRFSSFHIANSDKKSEIANKGFVLKRFLPTKQVSFRKRVLILFDWMKTRVFGRHTSIF
jgi:hypothetical protein